MLDSLIARGQSVAEHRPWPRAIVDREAWDDACDALAAGALTLSGLWGERDCVHMALLDESAPQAKVALITLPCAGGSFPSVGKHHPPAIRLERAIRDIYGPIPEDAPDTRPWLDHGRWPHSAPGALAAAYPFLSAEGENLHQIPVGPIHAGIIEPGHFRFTASGETVVRLEQKFGYVHKGIEGLMAGAPVARAADLACHTSGDSAVAYGVAFGRAVEAAMNTEAPPRAQALRALMAELERIANHLGDFGAICNDASFALMHAHTGVLRERVLRASAAAFGHRLMMDCIVPGGVGVDLLPEGSNAIVEALDEVRAKLPLLIEIYGATASLQDRTVGTGMLSKALAQQFGAGGYVGRASGRNFDARRNLAYAPYDEQNFEVPVLTAGDVDARVWIRLREIEQSLTLISHLLARLPGGAHRIDIPRKGGEGMAIVEGFRGDVLVWVRLADDGTVAHCHLRDPSWFQWPLLEAAIENNIVADFPLCNKSFNCSYSGHDL